MIKVNNLKKEFERTKKSRKKEKFYAVSKTTLLRIIGGIMEPTSGEVLYDNMNFTNNEIEIKKEIAYLSGNTKIYQSITPYELMDMCLSFYEFPKEERKKIYDKINLKVGWIWHKNP